MSPAMNPAAPHHLPVFITAPGESDVFLNGVAVFLVVAVVTLGAVYFRLHALPEHLAHKNASKIQFEIVAVLALIGLFTHNTMFWIAALLLALVPIPDFHGPLDRMADALAKMAGLRRRQSDVEEWPSDSAHAEAAEAQPHTPTISAASEQSDQTVQAAGHGPR